MADMRTTLLRDHTFRAVHLVAILNALRDYYIIPGQEPAIAQRGAGANMSVDVGAFKYVLNGTFGEKTSTTNVAFSTADSTNDRIDILYVNASGIISVMVGTARAKNPAGESVWQKYEEPYPADFGSTAGIVLAEVLVRAGTTSIIDADIRNCCVAKA